MPLIYGIVLVVKSQRGRNLFRILIGKTVEVGQQLMYYKVKWILMDMTERLNLVHVTEGHVCLPALVLVG